MYNFSLSGIGLKQRMTLDVHSVLHVRTHPQKSCSIPLHLTCSFTTKANNYTASARDQSGSVEGRCVVMGGRG